MTEEERYEKLNDKLDRILDKIDGKLTGIDSKLQNHETRLVVLEVHDKEDGSGWKSQLLMLLAKGLIIGAITIASLAGAGGILTKLIGA